MSVYQRYASGNHDDVYFNQSQASSTIEPETGVKYSPNTNFTTKTSKTTSIGIIELLPLPGKFDPNNNDKMALSGYSVADWLAIFPYAVYFTGYDDELFGTVVVMVYENPKSGKICTLSITKFGVVLYQNLILDSRSRFWPSCENLLPEYQKSNVRRALAITLLKNYNRLMNHPGDFNVDKHWDETNAGTLASNMNLLSSKQPLELGCKLLELGLLQKQTIQSVMLDVIYDNMSGDENLIKENNELVFLLGEQLDQLFDPLLEYSPQQMDIQYSIPDPIDFIPTQITNNELIDSIINELVNVQTNFTMGLVNLLQNFVIPLRVYVLGTPNANSGISNINRVFPPTIDEITRINCIMHGNLEKASKLGYNEVLKLMGILLPYFYKAFIRHEANLKNFRQRLNRFYKKNKRKIFDNEVINKGKFSLTEMDSIINGSLLELPRLKLILKRLYETILAEKNKIGISLDKELGLMDKYYNNAIDVIDAFGYEDVGSFANGFGSQHRIFTPTGKLLTELASNWPSELQYGWMSRKVVGIYELHSVKEVLDTYIMIIFSDHLLFLNILDDRYYSEEDSANGFKKISLADVLMHSLVNEKPLPSLSQFPAMNVKYWCKINDVIVSAYKGISSKSNSENDFIRILNTSQEGFTQNKTDEKLHCLSFHISKSNDRVPLSNKIIELINKSKVLHKNQPFHLFKSQDSSFPVYSTAHEYSYYSKEISKSPFVLLLNYSPQEAGSFFEKNPEVFLQLNLSFINDHNIHILGMNKSNSFHVDEIITSEDLLKCLKEIIAKSYNYIFSSYNPITQVLSESYSDDLAYYTNRYAEEPIVKQPQQKSMLLPAEVAEPEVVEKAAIIIPAAKVRKEEAALTSQAAKVNKEVAHTTTKNRQNPAPRRRKSLIKIILDTFKKLDRHHLEKSHHEQQIPAETKISAPPQVPTVREPERKTSDHTIPEGQKNRFSHIYLPSPDLEKIETEEEEERSMLKFKPASRLPSLDFNARFRFPHPLDPKTREPAHVQVEEQAHEQVSRQAEEQVPENVQVQAPEHLQEPELVQGQVPEPLQVQVPEHVQGQVPEHGQEPEVSSVVNVEKENVQNPLRIFSPTSIYSSLSGKDAVVDPVAALSPKEELVESHTPEKELTEDQAHVHPSPDIRLSESAQHYQFNDAESVVVKKQDSPGSWAALALAGKTLPDIHATKQPIRIKPTSVTRKSHEATKSDSTRVPSITSESNQKLFSIWKASGNQRVMSETVGGKTRTSLDLDAFDLKDFYLDGESNWIAFSRDNSLQHEIRALKEAAHMDSIDVIDINDQKVPPASDKLFENFDEFMDSLDEDNKSVYYTPAQDPTAVLADFEPPTEPWAKKEESVQSLQSINSLSSSKYVAEFNKLMDKKFSFFDTINESQFQLDYSNNNDSASENDTLRLGSDDASEVDTTTSEAPPVTIRIVGDEVETKQETKPVFPGLASSSEDEYFSSQEYGRTINMIDDEEEDEAKNIARFNLNVDNQDPEKTPTTYNSTSSDITVINDMIGDTTIPIGEKGSTKKVFVEDEDRKAAELPSLSIRYNSVAYLSDIINGTVNFSLDEED